MSHHLYICIYAKQTKKDIQPQKHQNTAICLLNPVPSSNNPMIQHPTTQSLNPISTQSLQSVEIGIELDYIGVQVYARGLGMNNFGLSWYNSILS